MGKWTDKLYITHSEWSNEFGGMSFGGARTNTTGKQIFRRLPFYCCALSLQPVEMPYATKQGIIFDLENIVPYMKKYNSNPVTGDKLEAKDLFKLNFHKNTEGEYSCPVTFKVFTDHTHIVAIKPSGNVYSYEAVERLNIKAKIWRDLINDQPFTKQDIITLQDPHNLEKQNLETFHHLKNKIQKIKQEDDSSGINVSGSAKRILEASIKKTEKPKESPIEQKVNLNPPSTANRPAKNAANFSNSLASASLTSTGFTPVTVNETALLSEEEVMFKLIKKSGYIQIQTNFGDLNIELFCSKAPKTCYNFIMLARKEYYNNVKFHRNIPNFMIQGGDPTATGKGGESFWKKDFEDEISTKLSHSTRGYLSMANRGKDTNSSQFFITYRPCKHLDGKHTIFGKVVGGLSVLDTLEKVPVNKKDLPLQEIVIKKINIFSDPYSEFTSQLEKTGEGASETSTKKTEADEVNSFGASLKPLESKPSVSKSSSIGKYLNTTSVDTSAKSDLESDSNSPASLSSKKPRLNSNSYGNFSNW